MERTLTSKAKKLTIVESFMPPHKSFQLENESSQTYSQEELLNDKIARNRPPVHILLPLGAIKLSCKKKHQIYVINTHSDSFQKSKVANYEIIRMYMPRSYCVSNMSSFSKDTTWHVLLKPEENTMTVFCNFSWAFIGRFPNQ